MSFLVSEHDIGLVLRHLLIKVATAQVVASKDNNLSQSGRYAIAVSMKSIPTRQEITELEKAGAKLPPKTLAGLQAAWSSARHPEDIDVELLLRAGEIKGAALKRARRAPKDNESASS